MSKYVLHADVQTTRRKRLHHILDEHNQPVWSGSGIAAAFTFLIEAGVNEFHLEEQADTERFLVMVHPE